MPFSQDSEHQKQFLRQTDIVPGAGVLFPALNPSLKPLIVPPGVLQWKHQNPKWSFKIFFLPWHHSMKPLIVPPGVFQRNQRYCQWSLVFPVKWNLSGYPCCVQETFFADTLHCWSWDCVYPVLEYVFPEIEDVGFTLPNGARHTPPPSISSPGRPRLLSCGANWKRLRCRFLLPAVDPLFRAGQQRGWSAQEVTFLLHPSAKSE